MFGAGSRAPTKRISCSVQSVRAKLPPAPRRANERISPILAGFRRPCSSGRPRGQPTSSGASASIEKESLSSSLLARYAALLETRPLATKAVTSGLIALAGDVSCQLLAAQTDKEDEVDDDLPQHGAIKRSSPEAKSYTAAIDWGRSARFTLLGATFIAPALHIWFGFLIRKLPGTAVATIVKRVALDQLGFTPFFLASFLSTVMVVEGNAGKVASKLQADYPTTLVGNWAYWIPAQIVNFRFVPPAYQVLYANCLGFFWNMYLSFQSNKAIEDVPPRDESDK